MKKLICLLCMLALLGGCNYQELGNMDIVTGLSIEDGKMTACIADKNGAENVKTKYSGFGGAINQLSAETPGELYLGHMQVVCVDEHTARKDMGEMLNYLKRNSRVRITIPIIICRDGQRLDGITLARIVEQSAKRGISPEIPLYRLISDSEDCGIDGILPVLENGKIEGAALIKNQKLVDFVPKELIYCIMAVKGQEQTPLIAAGNSQFEAKKIKAHIEPKIVNGQLRCKINIKANVRAVQWQGGTLMQKSSRTEAEKLCADAIESHANTLLTLLRQTGCDVLGVGRTLYRSQPKVWENIEQQWDDIFRGGSFTVSAQVKLLDGGRVIEGGKR